MAIQQFLGREGELRALEAAYRSPESAFLPIYGRRRVGKSALILEFLREKPGLYFLGKQAPAALQIREFLQEAAQALDEPLLAGQAAGDWRTALRTVTERRPSGKWVLALDEFQWMAAAAPELPSVLQECWDRWWRPAGNVCLILCGSSVGFMEREVLGRRSPLFGHRTGQIQLRPFGYREATAFHPGYSVADQARTYFLCGGMPLYLKAFAPDRSVEMNLCATLLNEYSPLFREPEYLLREELRDVERYTALLEGLAGGSRPAGELAKETGIDPRQVSYYLNQLTALGYVQRRFPLTVTPPSRQSVRYSLEDPLLRFWFRFLSPNASFLQQRGAEATWRTRILPQWDSYCGGAFERLCREALPHLYQREGVAAAFQVGEYWDRAVQIDVVGVRDDHWVDLGECKWGTLDAPAALRGELERKRQGYPNPTGATVGLRLFVRGPAAPALAEETAIRVHTLEELYAQG